jgi:hypothetical protein
VRLVLGVRNDAVCFSVGKPEEAERNLLTAIAGITERKPVAEMFFVYSGYELGQAFAVSGNPNRLVRLKMLAADTNPIARAEGVSAFTDTTRTITFRVSGLLTPSIWRLMQR